MKNLRFFLFLIAVVVCGWFSIGIKNDNSIESFFILNSKGYKDFTAYTEAFGADEILIIGLCGDLLDTKIQGSTNSLIRDLKTIPDIDKVFGPEDFLSNSNNNIPLAIARAQDAGLIYPEKNVFGILGFFKPGVAPFRDSIYRAVISIEKKWRSSFRCFHPAGPTLLNAVLNKSGEDVVRKFFPLLLAASFIMLWMMYRSFLFVLATFLTIVCAEVLSLGIIGFMNAPFGMLMTLIPVMIFIFTLSASIHILNHFHLLLCRKNKNDEAPNLNKLLDETYKEKESALYYSLLTTAIGFLSLSLSHITPIRNMGIYTAISCGIIILSVKIPLKFLLRFYRFKNRKRSFLFSSKIEHHLVNSFLFLLRYRHTLLIISFIFIGYGVTVIKKLPIDTNALNYFHNEEKLKKDIQWVEENLTGMSSINILFDNNTSEKKIDTFLINLKRSDLIRSIITDKTFGNNPPIKFRSKRYHRIIIQSKTTGKDSLQEIKEIISAAAEKSGIENPVITGQYPMILESQETMIATLAESLFMAVLLISVVLMVVSGNIWLGIIASIPNIATVFSVFIFMKVLSISINITTVTVAAVALGMAVDDTIHIIIQYKNYRLRKKSYTESIIETLKTSGMAIIASSVVTVVGFFVLVTSNFFPIQDFGLLMSLTIVTALLFDLFITTVLLKYADKINGKIGTSPENN